MKSIEFVDKDASNRVNLNIFQFMLRKESFLTRDLQSDLGTGTKILVFTGTGTKILVFIGTGAEIKILTFTGTGTGTKIFLFLEPEPRPKRFSLGPGPKRFSPEPEPKRFSPGPGPGPKKMTLQIPAMSIEYEIKHFSFFRNRNKL
jgi:hypothetical protein